MSRALKKIRDIGNRIRGWLGISDDNEATKKTNEAIVHVAEETVKSADEDGTRTEEEAEEVSDAVSTVVVQGAMQEAGLVAAVSENPIASLSPNVAPDVVASIEAMDDEGAMLPDGSSVAEKAIGALEKSEQSSLKRVSGQLGPNEGGWYMNKETGARYYAKFYENPSQGKVEFIANSVYEKLGINAAHSELTEIDGREAVISSEIFGGEMTQESSEDVRSGFVADAFLANWDVIGKYGDNILRSNGGRDYRIDNGGSLIFRATGNKKKEYSPNDIPELRSMIDKNLAFQGITQVEIKRQAWYLLRDLGPEDIEAIVNKSGLEGEERDAVLNGMLGRRKYLVNLCGGDPREEMEVGGEDLLKAMEVVRTKGKEKRDAFLYDQQVFERELNSRLTKMDDLIALSQVEGSGVGREYATYVNPKTGESKQILVLVLKGYPYEMLTSGLSTGSQGPTSEGIWLMEHPEGWMKPRWEISDEDFGKKGSYADTISAAYSDSRDHWDTDWVGVIDYGFDYVLSNTVKITAGGDANTRTITPGVFELGADVEIYDNEAYLKDSYTVISHAGAPQTAVSNKISIKHLDDFPTHNENGRRKYNEIAFSRYDEAGRPRPPDYIRTREVNRLALKHAAYFDVPIVRIDRGAYEYPKTEAERREAVEIASYWLTETKRERDEYIEKEVQSLEKELRGMAEAPVYYLEDRDSLGDDWKKIFDLIKKKDAINASFASEDDRKWFISETRQKLGALIDDDMKKAADNPTLSEEEIAKLRQEYYDQLFGPIESLSHYDRKYYDERSLLLPAYELQRAQGAPVASGGEKTRLLTEVDAEIEEHIKTSVEAFRGSLETLVNKPIGEWSEDERRMNKELYYYAEALRSQGNYLAKLTKSA
ncbi:MAG: hypothetical protein K6F57_03730 [Candidatus Saccharibacteria bacterium]|nr:hypothetical protein [Candidatus Saccharibacteria bacterium]